MKLKIYGTCAAEGFPAMFCSCTVCENARKWGGKNIRTRSQAVIDDKILIDFSADTYFHVLSYGLDLRKIKACFITHGHDDHLYPHDLKYRIEKYGHSKEGEAENKKPLPVFATKESGESLKKIIESEVNKKDENALRFKEITPFKSIDIEGYRVTPVKASHAQSLNPCFYIFEKDDKAILWAHDTGYFPDETWDYIENSGIKFDFVSLDCTSTADEKAFSHHMGLKACCDVKERLLNKNADEKTVFLLNHFSHNGGLCYDELVPIAEKHGFLVSYDTIEFEI